MKENQILKTAGFSKSEQKIIKKAKKLILGHLEMLPLDGELKQIAFELLAIETVDKLNGEALAITADNRTVN